MIFRHKGWQKGDKCPECNGDKIRRVIIYEDLLRSDGEIYEMNIEQNNITQEKYICDECGQLLLKLPARKNEKGR